MSKNPLGKINIHVQPNEGDEDAQENAKKLMQRLGEVGFEVFEIRQGVGIHMSDIDAERVASILSEFNILADDVDTSIMAALHREPAEALIKAMKKLKETPNEPLIETKHFR